MIKYAAFISYRRTHGAELARLIRSELEKRGIATFLDVENLGAHHFDKNLLHTIQNTPNFILILTPNSLERCSSSDDWLLQEIVCALEHKSNIIPIFKNFEWPKQKVFDKKLKAIRELPIHNGIIYDHNYFEAMIKKLCQFLKLDQHDTLLDRASSAPDPEKRKTEEKSSYERGTHIPHDKKEGEEPKIALDKKLAQKPLQSSPPVSDLKRSAEITFSYDDSPWDKKETQELEIQDLDKPKLILRGHEGFVRSICFSPDNKWLISTSGIQKEKNLPAAIRIWSTETGELLKELVDDHKEFFSVTVHPDGEHLLAIKANEGGYSPSFTLWSIKSEQKVGEYNIFQSHYRLPAHPVEFSPDGKFLAHGAPNQRIVRLWPFDALLKNELQHCFTDFKIPSKGLDLNFLVRFSPDGSVLACAGSENGLYLISFRDGDLVKTLWGHTEKITAMQFNQDGSLLISASVDRTVKVWEMNSTSHQALYNLSGHTRMIDDLSVHPKMNIAASLCIGGIKFWDIERGELVHSLPRTSITSLSFSPDGRYLAAAMAEPKQKNITIWGPIRTKGGKTDSGRSKRSLYETLKIKMQERNSAPLSKIELDLIMDQKVNDGTIHDFQFSPDEKKIMFAGKIVTLWDLKTGQVNTLAGPFEKLSGATLSADGKWLAWIEDYHDMKITHIASGKESFHHSIKTHKVLFSPVYGNLLATIEDCPHNPSTRRLNLRDIEQGKITFFIDSQLGQHPDVSFTKDSKNLITFSGSSTTGAKITFWDIVQAKELFSLSGEFTPQDEFGHKRKIMATSYRGIGKLYSSETGQLLRILDDSASAPLKMDPKDNYIFSCGDDIRIWDIESGRKIYETKGGGNHAKISPSGDLLACTTKQGHLRIWKIIKP